MFEPIFEHGFQGLGCDLRSRAYAGAVGRDELHFSDADAASVIRECSLNPAGKVCRFRPIEGKSVYQIFEFLDRNLVRELNAGQSGSVQKLSEAALDMSGFERDAVE